MTTKRWALGIEYDGRDFFGWQSQPNGRTIQNALESALGVIACETITTTCAGRTDSGVHATAQVVHFDTRANRPETAWVRGVNRHLPESIRVCWAKSVDENFHARFSATKRAYRYALYRSSTRPALLWGRVGWTHHRLDETAIAFAVERIVGRHDFSAFRAAECQSKSPVKTVYRADFKRKNDLLLFDFEASGFLHHMIRNLMGALIVIGRGDRHPDWISELLAGKDRSKGAPTFSAAGLYLTAVTYPAYRSLPSPPPLPFD